MKKQTMISACFQRVKSEFLTLGVCLIAAPSAFAVVTYTGDVTPSGVSPSSWDSTTVGVIGNSSDATLVVNGGSGITSRLGYVSFRGDATATIAGIGSTWTVTERFSVGTYGMGNLNIFNGAAVDVGGDATLADYNDFANWHARVNVDGVGSVFSVERFLYVGQFASGTLNISNGGMVRVTTRLTVDYNSVGSAVNIYSGGMLSLGDASWSAGDGITEFLDLVSPFGGSDEINYWNGTAWSNIANATEGTEFTLSNDGAYTTLTVLTPIPEPGVVGSIFGLTLLVMTRRRKK